MTFDELKRSFYQAVAVTPEWSRPAWAEHGLGSDIVLHLPVIEWFASQCNHCTEFGLRDGNSAVALIAGCRGKVVSYDIFRYETVRLLSNMDLPCSWEFHQADTALAEIKPTDLLLIDTLHTYEHVKKELEKSAGKVRKYLIFHDTETCGERDRSGPNPNAEGITRAIVEFRVQNHQWRVVYETKVNNGLLVLERVV